MPTSLSNWIHFGGHLMLIELLDGSPGPEYWQQRADYKIKCSMDTKEQRLHGSETITYYNNSPSTLKYLWLQLDENEHAEDAMKHRMNTSSIRGTIE